MSAVPLQISPASPAGADGWLDLETASKRSGRSVGHLRRLCGDKWMGEGLARQSTSGTGRRGWEVHQSADPVFAPVKFPEQIGVDLRAFPQAKRETAMQKRAILDRWEKAIAAGFDLGFNRNQVTEQFLQQLDLVNGKKVDRSTLYNWQKKWRTGGLAGLIDGRGADTKTSTADDPFLAEIQRLYLNLRKPKLTACYEVACLRAADCGWQVRSIHACRRHIERLDKGTVLKLRYGEEAFVNQAESFIERDYSTLVSNEIWNSDHHRFDVIVKVGQKTNPSTGELEAVHDRPWLTAFQDLRSRKIVGWKVYAHDPNSDVIFTVFRQAAVDCGLPSTLIIDNGKDFDCKALTGLTKKKRRWNQHRKIRVELDASISGALFPTLGIKLIHAQTYHGQSKPIERWFGFVETRTVGWDTYCGKDTQSKPEDLEKHLDAGHAPTLEKFASWFDEWVTAYNAGHAHSGDSMEGKTPDAVYAENLQTKRTAPRELLDELCLKAVGPIDVGQNGVAYQNLRYGKHEAALHQLLGKQVMLRVDERDLSMVRVYSIDGRFVCLAESNQRLPANADAQLLRQANSAKRSDSKLRKSYHQRQPRMAEDHPAYLLRAAHAKAQAAPPTTSPSPNIRPVRSALEDQLPALQRAIERRQLKPAVGAEQSVNFNDIGRAVRAAASTAPASEQSTGDAFASLRHAFKHPQRSDQT
jgi:transposase InsO family protein